MMLFFTSLSESETHWWLVASEILLLAATVLLVIGLIGEWPDSESWRKRKLYKFAKLAVILGVAGEFFGDAGIFETSARLSTLEGAAVAAANEKALAATERALNAELELKKFREFRSLKPEQQDRVAAAMKPFARVQFDGALATLDPEQDLFLVSIEEALQKAGLISIDWVGPAFAFNRDGRKRVGMAGAWGLVLHVHELSRAELMPAAFMLLGALGREGFPGAFHPKVGLVSTNQAAMHILVGPKH